MRNLLVLALLAAPLAVLADAGDAHPGHSIGSHRIAAGGTLEVTEPVAGDALLAGEYITLKAPVAGSVFALGAHVDVQDEVGKGLYAMAESIRVAGTVHDHARLAGDTVEITSSAHLEGPVSIAARTAKLAGELPGGTKVAARSASIDGHIAGDLEVSAENLEIGPAAHIDGRLRYRGDRAPVIASGAEVTGGIDRLPSRHGRFSWGGGHHLGGFGHGLGFGASLLIGIAMLLLGPAFMTEASTIARRDWAQSLGVGFMVLVGTPIAAVLLAITLIGIPVALLLIMLFAALLMLGYVCGAIAVGDFGLQTFVPKRAASTGARILALVAALIALALLRHVRLLGDLVVFLVFLAGVGALLQRAFRKVPPASAV
jgi:cytoskeletal protein CcmA (bactofilin family)